MNIRQLIANRRLPARDDDNIKSAQILPLYGRVALPFRHILTMATHRGARFPSTPYVEPSQLPEDIPKVEEIGTTSAPLKSASFFLGSYCQKYNEDYMLCKNESQDPGHCLKEGRRVTRCAQDL